MVGAAVLLAGAGLITPVVAGASSPFHPTTAQNHRTAIRDAAELLGRLQLPPGANPSAQEPAGDGGLLKDPPAYPATPNLVDQPRWWTANESPQQVTSYVKAHAPTGGVQNFGGSQGQCAPHTTSPRDCHTVSSWVGFTFHYVQGVLASRWLLVEVTRLKNGSTGIRVDADVVWISSRPEREQVPAGIRVVNVVQATPGRPPSVSKTVTRRSQVRRIIALIDQLPITQPGVAHCPPESGSPPIDTFIFRRSRHGPALARASVSSQAGNTTTNCDAMSFSIRGHSEPALGQPRSFLVGIQRLLGVHLISSR